MKKTLALTPPSRAEANPGIFSRIATASEGPALSPRGDFPEKSSRIEPLNRSSRREEALAISDFGFRTEPPHVGCAEVHGEGIHFPRAGEGRPMVGHYGALPRVSPPVTRVPPPLSPAH